jgi:hypothetical protein
MFFNLFSPRKRAASREFEIAIRYLLHDAENVIPFLKEAYKDKWSGFIDNILSGTRPYEEAAAVIGSFMQDSFQGLDRQKRHEIVASIAGNNLASPPNLLRVISQVSYLLYLAEKDHQVRENCWLIWLNEMSRMFTEVELPFDDCRTYLLALADAYREAKRSEHV